MAEDTKEELIEQLGIDIRNRYAMLNNVEDLLGLRRDSLYSLFRSD
jgi:hypothetical protein